MKTICNILCAMIFVNFLIQNSFVSGTIEIPINDGNEKVDEYSTVEEVRNPNNRQQFLSERDVNFSANISEIGRDINITATNFYNVSYLTNSINVSDVEKNDTDKVKNNRYEFLPPLIPTMESFIQGEQEDLFLGLDDINFASSSFPNDISLLTQNANVENQSATAQKGPNMDTDIFITKKLLPSFYHKNNNLYPAKAMEVYSSNFSISERGGGNSKNSVDIYQREGPSKPQLDHKNKKINALFVRYGKLLNKSKSEKRIRDFLRYLNYRYNLNNVPKVATHNETNSKNDTNYNTVYLKNESNHKNHHYNNEKEKMKMEDVEQQRSGLQFSKASPADTRPRFNRATSIAKRETHRRKDGVDVTSNNNFERIWMMPYESLISPVDMLERIRGSVLPESNRAINHYDSDSKNVAFLKYNYPFGISSLNKIRIRSNSINRDESELYDVMINQTPLIVEQDFDDIYNQTYRQLLLALTASSTLPSILGGSKTSYDSNTTDSPNYNLLTHSTGLRISNTAFKTLIDNSTSLNTADGEDDNVKRSKEKRDFVGLYRDFEIQKTKLDSSEKVKPKYPFPMSPYIGIPRDLKKGSEILKYLEKGSTKNMSEKIVGQLYQNHTLQVHDILKETTSTPKAQENINSPETKSTMVFSEKDIIRSGNIKFKIKDPASNYLSNRSTLSNYQNLKSLSIKKLEEQEILHNRDAPPETLTSMPTLDYKMIPTKNSSDYMDIKKSILEIISTRGNTPLTLSSPKYGDVLGDGLPTLSKGDHNYSVDSKIQGSLAPSNTSQPPQEANVCLTPQCVEIAASILSSMDQSVEPCNDFYQYSCGKWDREHVIPEGESKVTPFSELNHQLNVKIKGLLEEPARENDRFAVKKVKMFYESCINETYIEGMKTGPLLKFLERHGGWPVLFSTSKDQTHSNINAEGPSSRFVNDQETTFGLISDNLLNFIPSTPKWDEDSFDPIQTIANLRKNGINVIFREGLNPDKRNSSIYIVEIDQPKFRFMREYYLNKNFEYYMKSYLAFMVEIAEYLGADSRSMTLKELNQTLAFEIKLANISSSQSRYDLSHYYTMLTVAELIKEVPQVDWLKYFRTLMPNLNENDLIGVLCLEYFKELGNLLTQTPKRTLANFIMWKTVQHLIPYTNRDLIDMEKAFNKLVGSGSFKPRWKICVFNTLKYFPLVSAHLFLQKYFDTETKESIFNMSREIKMVFNERLPNIDWMDNQTRVVARKKADFIIKKIAYPDIVSDLEYLDNVNKEVNVTREHYFANFLAFENLMSQNDHKYFRKYVNRSEWKDTVMDVNAYYHWNMNYIIIPAGILQSPFYKNGYPKSVNYGRIGFIIGHETTHAFDSLGSQYNEFGNQKDWWSKEITKKFQDKADCIIDQYGNYTIPALGISLNGFRTQGENIADNGGIKQAYAAFKKSEQIYGKDYKLPGLNLDHDQIFFLSYAQIWCGLTSKSKILNDLHSSSHPYERFRVLGTLSNFPVFSDAYKCPLGSTMNPLKKCSVW